MAARQPIIVLFAAYSPHKCVSMISDPHALILSHKNKSPLQILPANTEDFITPTPNFVFHDSLGRLGEISAYQLKESEQPLGTVQN